MLWALERTDSKGDSSFESPKQMFKLMDKKIFTFFTLIMRLSRSTLNMYTILKASLIRADCEDLME